MNLRNCIVSFTQIQILNYIFIRVRIKLIVSTMYLLHYLLTTICCQMHLIEWLEKYSNICSNSLQDLSGLLSGLVGLVGFVGFLSPLNDHDLSQKLYCDLSEGLRITWQN